MATVLEVIIRARDQASAVINKTAGSAQGLSRSMNVAGATMARAGATATRRLTLPLIGLAAVGVKSFASFDKAMTESLAIMGDVSTAMRKDMADAAKQVARDTTFSAKEAAEGYFFLASAGLDAKQSLAALPAVAKFAQAGNFDLARATDLATDAQSALGLKSKDAAKNLENLKRVQDVLVKANTKANATVEQFSESVTNKAGPAARALGKDVEETTAVLAVFADQGVKGQVAGNALNIVWRDLATQARKNEDAFKKHNVAVFDSNGAMRNTADIVGDLEDALEGMTTKQQRATLAQLGFQDRSVAFILALLGTSDAIRGYESDLRDAADTTDEVANKQMEALSAKLKVLRNRAELVAITLGARLAPTVERLARRLVTLIEKFQTLTPEMQKVVLIIGGVAAAIGPALFFAGKLITTLGFLAGAFSPIGAAAALAVAALAGIGAALANANLDLSGIKQFAANFWAKVKAALFGPAAPKITNVRLLADVEVKPIFNVRQLEAATRQGGLIDKLTIAFNQLDWAAIGRTIASGIAKTLEVTGLLAGKLTEAFIFAVASVPWDDVGKEIARGFKKGVTGGVRAAGLTDFGPMKEWAKKLLRDTFIQPWKDLERTLVDDAEAAGRSATRGAKRGFSGMPPAVTAIVARAIASVSAQEQAARAAGHRVGAAIGSGVKGGIGSMIGGVIATATSLVAQAIMAARVAADARSPSRKTEREVGRPLGEGIVRGWILGTRDLPATITDTIRRAVDRARTQVERARGVLQGAFDRMGATLFRAFDAATGAHRTPAEEALDTIRARREQEDLARALADAEKDLNAARMEGDPDRIAEAEFRAARAREDIEVAALEKRADRERTEFEARRENLRTHLEERLAAIQAHWETEGITTQQGLARITKLMRRHGISFNLAAKQLGTAFARGLRARVNQAASAAQAIAKAVERALAREFNITVKVARAAANAPGRAHGGPVLAGHAYRVGERGEELFVPGQDGRIVPNHMLGGDPSELRQIERILRRILAAIEAQQLTLDGRKVTDSVASHLAF